MEEIIKFILIISDLIMIIIVILIIKIIYKNDCIELSLNYFVA